MIIFSFFPFSILQIARIANVPDFGVEALVFVRSVRFGDPRSGSQVFGNRCPVFLPGEFRNVIVDIEHDDSNDARSSQRRRTCKTGSVIVD